METAASVIAVIQISTAIISACNKYLRNVRHAADEIRNLRDGVEAYLNTTQKLRELTESAKGNELAVLGSVRTLIEKSEVDLRGLETRLTEKEKKPMRRLGLRALKWPFTKEEVNDALGRLGHWRDTLKMALLTDTFSQNLNAAQSLSRAEQSRLLEKLPCVAGAAFDSRSQEHDPQCLPGTRTEILQRLISWSRNPDSEPICWLRGMAGTGKSTIARTVASQLHDMGCLGGSFFFSRGGGDRGHAGKLITTLADQLAGRDLQLKQNICDVVMGDKDIAHRNLAEQCRRLIVEPVKKLAGDSATPLVFVIDALDECDSEEDIEIIPQLLTILANVRTKFRLLVLIAGRPERSVRRGFLQVQSHFHHEFDLFDIDEAVVKQDISLLINEELKRIRSRHGLPDSWPASQDEVIDTLSTKAGSLFIYAKTVCRFVSESPRPQHALGIVTEDSSLESSQSPVAMLNGMYLALLRHSYIGDSFLFKRIIGSIVLLKTQFSIAALSGLLTVDESVIASVLHNLHSVLHVPTDNNDPLYLLHPSFRDFLLDAKRCTDTRFQLHADELHRFLAHNCMRNMQQCLRANVCRLEAPGCSIDDIESATVAKHIQLETSYACRNWVYHLREAGEADPSAVRKFIASRLLQWLEALALLGHLYLGIHMVQDLRNMRALQANSSLDETLDDIYRYLMQHRSLIENVPLQMYHSAILFSPEKSFPRRVSTGLLRNAVVRFGPTPASWSPCLQTWEGSGQPVISPSMDVVACRSGFSTTKLRETITGRCISTLDISPSYISHMTFSADGSLLLIITRYPERVSIWNTRLAVCMHVMEGRDLSRVGHAAFGDSDKAALTTYSDGDVIIWDPQNGICLHCLEGHTGMVWYAEFSADGKHIVSSSADATVRIWGSKSGASIHTLNGHRRAVRNSRFMTGDRHVVSVSEDSTIRVWDAVLGTCLRVLETETSLNMAISPEKTILACVVNRRDIRLWDPVTAVCLKTLQGHLDKVVSIQFSGDGRKLISTSDDFTIRIWEVTTGECLRVLDDILKGIGSGGCIGILTRDGGRIYDYGSDGIDIWECENSLGEEVTQPRHDRVKIVKFCDNRNLAVSAGANGTLAIWDALTGSCIQHLTNPLGWLVDLAISSSGKKVACLTHGELRILDTGTGSWAHIIQCIKDKTQISCFSPDERYLAYISHGRVHVRLVETTEYALECAISEEPSAVIFSPDSKLLAVLGPSGLAQIYAIPTEETGGAFLDGCNLWLQPCRQANLAIFISDGVIGVWNVCTGKCRFTLEDASTSVRQIQQSFDGKVILSSHSDENIRVWNTETGCCDYILNSSSNHLSRLAALLTSEFAVFLSARSKISLWNPSKGDSMTICLDAGTLNCSAFDCSLTRMAAGCADRTLMVFDLNSQQWETLSELPSNVVTVVFSSDGRKILSLTERCRLQIWDVSQSCCLASKEGILTESPNNSFSPDGTMIASCPLGCDNGIEIWSAGDAIVLHTLYEHSAPVQSITWSPNGKTLASALDDHTIRLWCTTTGSCLHVVADFVHWFSGGVYPGFSADNALFSYYSSSGKLKILDSKNGECVLSRSIGNNAKLLDAQFSKSNEILAVIREDDNLEVWNISRGQKLNSKSSSSSISYALLSTEKTLVLTSEHAWNYQQNQVLEGPSLKNESPVFLIAQGENIVRTSKRRTSILTVLEFGAGTARTLLDGEYRNTVMTCSHQSGLVAYTHQEAGGICLWDIHEGRRYLEYNMNYGTVRLLRFSLDDTTIVGVLVSGRIFSYNIKSGVKCGPISSSRSLLDEVIELYLSYTAKIIAAIHESHHIQLWDMKRGECISTITGHHDWVRKPSFSEDHNLVAAISIDNTVRVWKTDTAQLVAYFPFAKPLYGVSITDDGLSLLVNDGLTEAVLLIQDGTPASQSAFYWLSLRDEWIMWKQYRVIWIPPEYRLTLGTIHRNTVMLISKSGHVLFLQLGPDLDPTKWSFEDPLLKDPELLITEDSIAAALGDN